jgi:hypothetical protein
VKTITARDQTHLDSGYLTTATLWKITRRDGEIFGFTDHDQDIEFGGLTYDASTSYNRTATADGDQLAPSNMIIESVLDSTLITESDILAGLWDYAQVEVRTVNWMGLQARHITGITKDNPGVVTAPMHDFETGDEIVITGVVGMSQVNGVTYTISVLTTDTFSIVDTSAYSTYLNSGIAKFPESSWDYRLGRIGQVSTSGQTFGAELMGLAKQLEKTLLRPYLPSCPAILGDAECTVNLASFTHTGAVDTVDATGLQLTDVARLEASGYFDYGLITMTSGASAGYSMEVKVYTVGVLLLQQPLPFGVSAGDEYSIRTGCDKTFSTCKTKFNNVVNFQGFPHLPGQDKVLSYGN